jgi:hypothetical protein
MSLQTIDRRLGRTRVAFTELVQLRSGSEHALWTHATDLCERGLHVRADAVLSPGTPMELVLPLPHAAQSLALRGRVAWSHEDREPGMGIELVDLSELELSYLRREVMEGKPREWRREVKVWFEGTREPTRALALGTGSGLQLVSDLGFLRLGSQVVVYGEAGASPLVGSLSEVALRRSGHVPQLVIEVEAPRPEPGEVPDGTWTHWPPPPVRSIAEETRELIIEEAAYPEREVHVLEPSSIAGAIEAHTRPEPAMVAEPTVDAGAPRSEGWELGSFAAFAAPEASDWKLRGPALTQRLPRVRRRRRWLWWLAAALMVGTTLASMSYTQSWLRVRDRLQALLGELGLRLTPRAAELSPRSAPRLLATDPPALPVIVPTQPTSAPAAPSPSVSSPPPGRPLVDESARRLAIPLRGSLREVRSYPLAAPAGLAINLPHARPLAGYGDFELQKAGFRAVWVRRRGEGLHIRVFHNPGLRASLSLAARTLTVELREAETP